MFLAILLLSVLGFQESFSAEMAVEIRSNLAIDGKTMNGIYDYRSEVEKITVKSCEEIMQRIKETDGLKQVPFDCKGACLRSVNGRIRTTVKMTVSSLPDHYICGKNSIQDQLQLALNKGGFTYLKQPTAIVLISELAKNSGKIRAELKGTMFDSNGRIKYADGVNSVTSDFAQINRACDEVQKVSNQHLLCTDGIYINQNGKLGVIAKIDFTFPQKYLEGYCGGDKAWYGYFMDVLAKRGEHLKFNDFRDFTVSVPFQ